MPASGEPSSRTSPRTLSAFRVDPRGSLYLRYLHHVEALKPLAILMENVPDALNYGGHNILAEMAEVLQARGYVCRYALLNAAFFGVPQIRIRAFLLAYHQCLDVMPAFPVPTHECNLPAGYGGVRKVALKHVDLFSADCYAEAPTPPPGLPMAVSAAEAIGDLPPITGHLTGEIGRGRRRLDQAIPYAEDVAQPLRAFHARLAGF